MDITFALEGSWMHPRPDYLLVIKPVIASLIMGTIFRGYEKEG